MAKNKQEQVAPPIINPIVDIDKIKLKIVHFIHPTMVNFMLVDKIHTFADGEILLHQNYITFKQNIVPLSNVKIMEVLDE